MNCKNSLKSIGNRIVAINRLTQEFEGFEASLRGLPMPIRSFVRRIGQSRDRERGLVQSCRRSVIHETSLGLFVRPINIVTDSLRDISSNQAEFPEHTVDAGNASTKNAYWLDRVSRHVQQNSTGGDRIRLGVTQRSWRAVVDQLATLKADQTTTANGNFALAA